MGTVRIGGRGALLCRRSARLIRQTPARPPRHPPLFPTPMRCFRLALVALAPLALAACDPTVGGGGENVSLSPRTRTATFDFACDTRPAGQTLSLTSGGTMSFGATGDLDGFQTADILSATVTGVTIRRDIPSGLNLGAFLSGVTVSLVGAQTVAVGTSATLPGSNTATLTASGSDVGAVLRGAPFRARIDGTVVAPRNDECRIEATMTFRVVVKGF